MKNPTFRKEYEKLDNEFSLAEAFIAARKKSNLTQDDIAKRMATSQSVIARLESGTRLPSTKTLLRYAKATNTKLKISFL